MSKVLKINPEFSCEIVMVAPYAYWLHQRGELQTIITSKGMKPFYYFCDDVREDFEYRTVSNEHLTGQIPNNWIHHNCRAVFGKNYDELTVKEREEANGVLDYSQWTPPPYKEHYKNDRFKFDKPVIVISNRYNYEHGKFPRGFFDIQCLYDMFNYFTENGYKVIYKRPQNTEFPLDDNELMTINDGCKLEAEVEGIGLIDDYQLTEYYDDVYLIDDILKENSDLTYNELQMMLFSNADGFVTMGGGSGILCSYFGGTNITYITTSKELRKGYFGPKSHYRMTSGCNVIPIRDPEDEISKRGYRDYTELFKRIKENF